ncbi:replication initiator [Microbacterium esteraromaticum]|uniref:replication initiator n=1 Tax=Microbacterium esteraromaticum TaxID=57043 RepID=UPI003C2F25FD
MDDQGQPTEAPDSTNALHDAQEAIGLSPPCPRPVSAARTNKVTGESEEMLIRCNTRKARIYPSCAAPYRGDVNAIMRDGIQTAAEDDAVVFLTVTAPSFGRIRHVPRPAPPRLSARKQAAWDRSRQRRCACGSRHTQGEKRYAGVPVSPGEHDYAGQVRFNLAAGGCGREQRTSSRGFWTLHRFSGSGDQF